jgi:hypothetical protein
MDPKDESSIYAQATYGAALAVSTQEGDSTKGVYTDQGLFYAAGHGTDADKKRLVEITLTPKGKLIDGSDGKPIVGRVAVLKSNTYSGFVRGIPIGDYTAVATLVEADGKLVQKLRVSTKPGVQSANGMEYHVAWQPSAEIIFDTPYTEEEGNLGAKQKLIYVGR